jgi:hypothetical protein
MRVRFGCLVALAAAASLPLAAQTDAYVKRGGLQREGRAWVEETRCGAPVREGGRLVVRTHMGSVRISPGAADRMECRVRVSAVAGSEEEARALVSRFQLTARRVTGGGVYLGGEAVPDYPRRVMWNVSYEIQVPLRFSADIETRAGGIQVEKLDGELRAVTAGGDIRAGDVTGPVRAETAGGNIELGHIGQRLEARTAGGCVTVGDVKGDAVLETSGGQIIAGRIEGGVRAETAGGDIVLRSARTDIIAETAGGQIRIGEGGGSVRAETSGGSILLSAARGPIRVETAGGSINLYRIQGPIRATTAAGKILAEIAATAEAFAASELETAFGDVEVYLPPDLPLTIDATIEMAAGHKILTDFPLEIEDGEPRYQPAVVRGRGAVNGGGQLLRIHTVGGNIEIRKLTPALLESLQQKQQWLWQQWQEKEKMRLEKERLREQRRQQRREKEVKREQEPPSPF